MPAIANILLNDALATPVAHTFIPTSFDAKTNTWWFEDQVGAASIAFNRISVKVIKPLPAAAGARGDGRMNRVLISIHEPKPETLATNDAGIVPAPSVAYICRCSMEFIMPERAVLQDRKDLRKFAQFLLADSNIVNIIENVVTFY